MIDANVDILPLLLLLLNEAGRQATTSCVDHITTLLALYRRVQAQVLSTGEAETPEFLFVAKTFCAKLHEGLQLDEGLFDLGHCP